MDVRERLEVIAHLCDHISYKEDIGICYDSTLAKVIEDAYMELKSDVNVQSGIDANTFQLMREIERLKEEKESLANAVNVLEEINSDLCKQIKGVTVQECGEWVYDHWCEFKCSVCGEFSNSKPYKGKENYCPNCGAKMMPNRRKENDYG